MLTQEQYADLHTALSGRLERIAALFSPGVRLTLIVRVPGNPDGTTYLSDDNVADVLSAINYIREKAVYVAGPREPERETGRRFTHAWHDILRRAGAARLAAGKRGWKP